MLENNFPLHNSGTSLFNELNMTESVFLFKGTQTFTTFYGTSFPFPDLETRAFKITSDLLTEFCEE